MISYSDIRLILPDKFREPCIIFIVILLLAAILYNFVDNSKYKKIFYVFFPLSIIFVTIISYYCFVGYYKKFYIYVADENKKNINDFSVLNFNDSVELLCDESKKLKFIFLYNKIFPKSLVAKHYIYDSDRKEIDKEKYLDSDNVEFEIEKTTNDIIFDRNKKGFIPSRSKDCKFNDNNIVLLLSKTKDNYISILDNSILSNNKFEIRTRYSLLNKNSSFIIEIGDSVRVYVGEKSNIIKIKLKSVGSNDYHDFETIELPTFIDYDKNNFISVSMEKESDYVYCFTIKDNQSISVNRKFSNIIVNKNSDVKFGCYSESKGQIIRLISTSFVTTKNGNG